MVKLPSSKELIIRIEYNFILVIINRLIKWGIFIPYKESSTAKDLIYIFFRWIVAEHALPRELILNRYKWFTSRFWKALIS